MLPLVAVVMTLCGVLANGIAWLGAETVSAARARTAADAAALAAAGDPATVDAVARANGAEVLDVEWLGSDVRVRVRMLDGRGAEAVARARGVGVGGGVVHGGDVVDGEGDAGPEGDSGGGGRGAGGFARPGPG